MATGDYIQKPRQMDPLPLPEGGDTPQQAEQMGMEKMQMAQRQPPGSGYAKPIGQASYIANNILQGWMAGRHIKQTKLLDKAKGEVTSAQGIYDQLADVYRNNVAAGKDKNSEDMKKLSSDITAAWTNYVNTADKFTAPEDEKTGKKKEKGKLAKMFGMDVDPEMFRKGSVNLLRQSGPPVLREEESVQSKAARAQLDATNLEIQQRKDQIKQDSEWKELSMIDPSKRTEDQQKRLDAIERVKFPKSVEQATRDDLIKKVTSGQKLADNDREMAEQLGILRHNQPTMLQHKDADGTDWVIAVDEKGNEVGRKSLGKGYVPPDQATLSQRIMQQQHDAMVADYKKAFGGPGVDPAKLEQDAQRFALYASSGFKSWGGSPAEAEQAQFMVSDAIKTVRGELSKDQKAILDNFVVAPTDDPNGLYYWRTSMVQPQGESGMWWWKKPTYYGGIGQGELKGYEREMIDRLRMALQKKHKNLTPEQVKQLIPESMFKGQDGKPADRSMSTSPGSERSMAPLPGEKFVSKDTIKALAEKNNVPYDVAEKQFMDRGYSVK